MPNNPEHPMDPEEMKLKPENPEDAEAAPRTPETEESPESEINGEVERELADFEHNTTEVEKATADFEGPEEMADLAKNLTSEQKQQLEEQITELQKRAASHKYSAGMGLSNLNPKEAFDYIASDISDTSRLSRFMAYASGGMAVVGLDEFFSNGAKLLRDKHRIRKLEKERRKLDKK